MNLMITDSSLRERIDQILPRVAKPARYTGGELNAIQKQPKEARIRFALAFPDVYEVGMSNLGLRILYHILNSEPGVAAERVFAPATDMEAEMRAAGIPLFSLESTLPLGDFDIVGFSLAYELCYTTVLNMLDLAGIPVFSSERTSDDPIIIAGGHCATNPEPMADFIDAFVIGDGEEVVVDIINAYRSTRGNRVDALKALSSVDGVYVPTVHGVRDPKPAIRGRVVMDLDRAPFPDKMVVPFTEAVHDRVTVEIMRGCSRGCRFCQAGMITRPVRERSIGTVCEQAEKLLEATGYEEIALTSLSSADYSGIQELVHELVERHEADKVGISLPSLRADAECVHLAQEIQRVRKSGLTFAPEAGTQRLRDVINKGVTEDDLLGAVEAALECGWRHLKLYFMIGLPTETDEDIIGIGDLVSKVIQIGRNHRAPLTLNVTISPFVPKPHTPFQWRGMVSLDELDRKIALARPLLRGKNIKLSWHDPRGTQVEAALARGDSLLSQVIYEVWKNGGNLEQDRFNYDRWLAAFSKVGLDVGVYAHITWPKQAVLPWYYVNVGVSQEFLANEDERAEQGQMTQDCKSGACSGCGVRDTLTELFGKAVSCPPEVPRKEYTHAEKPAAGQAQQEARVLFAFRKTEQAKWLGHLDLLRVFDRAVRMSGIDLVFTQGFNPRPKMSIASALPLGATADREYFTVAIVWPFDLTDVTTRLNHALPPGVRLVDAAILPDNKKGPEVTGSEYIVGLRVPNTDSAEKLPAAIESLMGRAEILVERESSKRRRMVDLRPGIESLELLEVQDECDALIRMRLPHLEFTVKPSEIVQELGKLVPAIEITSMHRAALLTD